MDRSMGIAMHSDNDSDMDISDSFDYDEGLNYMLGEQESRNDADKISDEREEIKNMSKTESIWVKRWRRNVFLVILSAATLVTTLTYVYLNQEDVEDFETAANQFANAVKDSTTLNLAGVIDAMHGLGEVFTSQVAKSQHMQWPFVTLSSFEILVQYTRAQTSAELLVLCPIVEHEKLSEWNTFSTRNQTWIEEAFAIQQTNQMDLNPIPTSIYRFGNFKGKTVLSPEDGNDVVPSAPFWQMSPPPFDTSIVNFNALSVDPYRQNYQTMMETRSLVVGKAQENFLLNYAISEAEHDRLHGFDSLANRSDGMYGQANAHPHSSIILPVFETLKDPSSKVVAFLVSVLPWDLYLKNLLPNGVDGVYCVLKNSCGQEFTYMINGNNVEYIGLGDSHDTGYDDFEFVFNFDDLFGKGVQNHNDACRYWLSIFPSSELESQYHSNVPLISAIVVASSFALMAMTFIIYDNMVVRKNNKLVDSAAKSGAIVSSLFPSNVRDRLMEEQEKTTEPKQNTNPTLLGDFLDRDMSHSGNGSRPIADLFQETSIIFMDLAGFTKWCSKREPCQVFFLLETLFAAFDKIAQQRRIYKVETIGDCWVGVSGLPVPRSDYAVAMCRFARDCLFKANMLLATLAEKLGPDTGDIQVRIGIHSGPVTGGVLRGERSRFQLFGDSMNTASRMESTGKPGAIHISEQTAQKLTEAGKAKWALPREDTVNAKGKGELQTYWLTLGNSSFGSTTGHSISDSEAPNSGFNNNASSHASFARVQESHHDRLVRWVVDELKALLVHISFLNPKDSDEDNPIAHSPADALSEISDNLPFQVANRSKNRRVGLPLLVEEELVDLVLRISGLYNDLPFHNFSHAVQVARSTKTFLTSASKSTNANFSTLASDPFVQFACIFAALIHDADHPAVPNRRLVVENPERAAKYKNAAIAEQHSLSVSWDLLQEKRYENLRAALFRSETEKRHFRLMLVNAILATDIDDTNLRRRREQRFEKVIHQGPTCYLKPDLIGEQLAVLIDLVIQSADVSHTMQYWDNYLRWNECLLREMYRAYSEKRSDQDPTANWLQGEKGFFDSYVIPLALKLQACELFGHIGETCLALAHENRKQLNDRGSQAFAEIIKDTKAGIDAGEESAKQTTTHV